MIQIAKLKSWLEAELTDASNEAKESSAVDPNCYGAGYDNGYMSAIAKILRIVNEQEEID